MKKKMVSREEDIHTLLEIIKNKEDYKENSENGLVILLNGEWGTGKTTFLNNIINETEKNTDFEVFNYYNAYENDYYDNAYIPFFASIENKIQLKSEFTNFIKSVSGEVVKDLIVVSYAVTKSIFKRKFDIDIDDIKSNLKDLQEEKYQNDYVKNYKDFQKYKSIIKIKMKNICSKKTQIFIIDELDRCKPNFAMETLEIVKHFFDIENCIFIISVDKIQLEKSVESIYGDINSEKYFSKLFDYQFNLFPINFYDAIDWEEKCSKDLVELASHVFGVLNISLRDSKKIFNELISKNKDWTIYQSSFMLFLFILKYTDLSFYRAIMNKDFLKYKNLFDGNYNGEFEKYKRLFNITIGHDLKYGEILVELNHLLNKQYSSLGSGEERTYISLGNYSKSAKAVGDDIIKYIPQIKIGLTVKENITKIIG